MPLNCMQHVFRHFSRPILCQQRRNSRQGFEHIFDPPSGTQPIYTYIYILFLYFIDLKKHMGSPQTVTFFSCGIHPTPVGIRRVILEDLIRQNLPKNNHHSAGSSIELFLPNCGVCSRFFLESGSLKKLCTCTAPIWDTSSWIQPLVNENNFFAYMGSKIELTKLSNGGQASVVDTPGNIALIQLHQSLITGSPWEFVRCIGPMQKGGGIHVKVYSQIQDVQKVWINTLVGCTDF